LERAQTEGSYGEEEREIKLINLLLRIHCTGHLPNLEI